jgi:hypothetical protein
MLAGASPSFSPRHLLETSLILRTVDLRLSATFEKPSPPRRFRLHRSFSSSFPSTPSFNSSFSSDMAFKPLPILERSLASLP